MGSVIAVVSQKGGVGKTTTVVNLATAFAEGGLRRRTLVVDLDSQGHASTALGAPRDSGLTIASVLWDGVPISEAIHREPRLPGVDVVAGSQLMAEYDMDVADQPDRYQLIAQAIRPVSEGYDLTLLDLPPGVGLIHAGAYVAADWVLAPTTPEAYAVRGLVDLRQSLQQAQHSLDAPAQLLGVLITMSDHRRTREHRLNIAEIRDALGSDVLRSVIRLTTRCREAARHQRAVVEYDPDCTAAQDYMAAAAELLDRIRERSA